jgi:hypothetical protein
MRTFIATKIIAMEHLMRFVLDDCRISMDNGFVVGRVILASWRWPNGDMMS